MVYWGLGFPLDAPTWKVEARLALYSWFIKSSLTEIKAYYSWETVWQLIHWSDDRVADTIEALLKLSPPAVLCDLNMLLDEPVPLLPIHLIQQNWKLVNLLLAYGVDPHRVSSHSVDNIDAQTALSLAMYTSWTFLGFRNVLHGRGFDLEDFARQELKEGYPLLDDGWRVETLTALLELDFEPDISPCKNYGEIFGCSNCSQTIYWMNPPRRLDWRALVENWSVVPVQPYWRAILESIRRGTYPPRSCSDTRDDRLPTRQNHLSTSDKDSLVSTTQISDSSNDSALSEDEAARSNEEPSTSGSDNPSATFARDELWCMNCWLHFEKTGQRRTPPRPKTQSSDGDDSSDDDFSPFLFNT